jgi:hypothetical protein
MGLIILRLTEEVDIIGEIGESPALAKVDTGADRTSIDVEIASAIGAVLTGETFVTRYPTGRTRERNLARVRVRVKGEVHEVEAVLDERSNMKCRVVIGKDILTSGRFLILPAEERVRE